LYLNTSDESPQALADQRSEVLSFLEGRPYNKALNAEREREAVRLLEEARRL
jgi:hypothetical protein